MSEPFNWRKYLQVHPAANRLPMMSPEELQELADDITANGLRTGIVLWGKQPEAPTTVLPILIDGRNRLDAMAHAGVLTVNKEGHLCRRVSDGDDGLRIIRYNYRDGDPHKLSRSLNVIRRHLTPEAKRALIAKVLEADPSKSDRQIAGQTKTSPTTVGRVRAEKEAAGDVSTVDTRTDTQGRQQPAKKPPRQAPPRPPSEAVVEQILKLFQMLDDADRDKVRNLMDRLEEDEDRGAEGS
jgi:hypothetical protein